MASCAPAPPSAVMVNRTAPVTVARQSSRSWPFAAISTVRAVSPVTAAPEEASKTWTVRAVPE